MRPLFVDIRLDFLRDNYRTLKALHGGRLLAVVKANAYGHGAVPCAVALNDIADGFAVACLEEAVALRDAGIIAPVVLLEGVFSADEYNAVDRYRLWPVVGNDTQLQAFLSHPWQNPVTVWLKLDSGMHRTGFFPQDYAAVFSVLSDHPAVEKIVKMTHFACADEPGNPMTDEQIRMFDETCGGLPGEASIANSAAILERPDARRDWGRAGIALYGITPFGGTDTRLKPVMRLHGCVFGVRDLLAGEPVGYGAAFVTPNPMRIGLVTGGYADGYPRRAGSGTPVAVDGSISGLAGRLSMDMLTVRLSETQGIGSTVELWGDTVSVNTVAEAAGTIAYELLCNVKRAHRRYEDKTEV